MISKLFFCIARRLLNYYYIYRDGKGGENKGLGISERYDIGPMIGRGRNGRVYLARHRQLDAIRAIKIIPKESTTELNRYRKEAMILRDMKHPGIPLIIDIEEDQDNLYLIEEYEQGETLSQRMQIGVMSQRELIIFAIKLCDPIIYLHQREQAILHLDIQPSNLIISNKQSIKIIDFDHAITALTSDVQTDGFGTVGFAAPEQYTKETADIRTDIYAIGAICYYAGTGRTVSNGEIDMPRHWSRKLKTIIATCLSDDKKDRYESVQELLTELLSINSNNIPSQRIGIVGLTRGVGTTHISLGLASFLAHNHITSIYLECHPKGGLYDAMEYGKFVPDDFGVYKLRDIYVKPYYYDRADWPSRSATVTVEDYRDDVDMMIHERPDISICVVPGRCWRYSGKIVRESGKLYAADPKTILVCNLWDDTDRGLKLLLTRDADTRRIIKAPYIPDIFGHDRKVVSFYRKVLDLIPELKTI